MFVIIIVVVVVVVVVFFFLLFGIIIVVGILVVIFVWFVDVNLRDWWRKVVDEIYDIIDKNKNDIMIKIRF